MKASEITDELNHFLNISAINDASVNGLQVDCAEDITNIMTAVDISYDLLETNAGLKNTLILVHHGLYWKNPVTITGRYYKMIKKLITTESALAAYHLPLDIHPELGNNISLIKKLNLDFLETTGKYHGVSILFTARDPEKRPFSKLIHDFRRSIGTPLFTMGDPDAPVIKAAVVSGGGASCIEDALSAGADTFITGDAEHTLYHFCKENHIKLISGGHYNTEKDGVKNLGNFCESRFNLQTAFSDIPTGL